MYLTSYGLHNDKSTDLYREFATDCNSPEIAYDRDWSFGHSMRDHIEKLKDSVNYNSPTNNDVCNSKAEIRILSLVLHKLPKKEKESYWADVDETFVKTATNKDFMESSTVLLDVSLKSSNVQFVHRIKMLCKLLKEEDKNLLQLALAGRFQRFSDAQINAIIQITRNPQNRKEVEGLTTDELSKFVNEFSDFNQGAGRASSVSQAIKFILNKDGNDSLKNARKTFHAANLEQPKARQLILETDNRELAASFLMAMPTDEILSQVLEQGELLRERLANFRSKTIYGAYEYDKAGLCVAYLFSKTDDLGLIVDVIETAAHFENPLNFAESCSLFDHYDIAKDMPYSWFKEIGN